MSSLAASIKEQTLRPAIQLRPYQQESIEAVKQDVLGGFRKLLIALPTGAGKTIVFAHLPRALGVLKKRVLVLAHREELLLQAMEKISWCEPNISVGIEQASKYAGNSQIVVASVQTLQRERLRSFNPNQFGLVIIDEAHHAVAQSYINIIEHFKCGTPDGPILVGCTATPKRGDDIALDTVFDKISYTATIYRLIHEGYLSPIRGKRIETKSDLSDVKSRYGEFIASDLSKAVNTEDRNSLITKSYLDVAQGNNLFTVAFAVDVEHALSLAECMRSHGIRSEAIHGQCTSDQRAGILARFANGDIEVLTNCMILTEGFDEPRVQCLLMARPTRSGLLYVQMVGRGLRLASKKKECVVLDFADLSSNHKIFTLATLSGIPRKVAESEASKRNNDFINPYDIAKQLEDFINEAPWVDVNRIESLEQIQYAAYDVNFFADMVPYEIAQFTDHQYIAMPDGSYKVQLPGGAAVIIRPDLVGFEVTGYEMDASNTQRRPIKVIIYQESHKTLRMAVMASDSLLQRWQPDALKLIHTLAPWRRGAITDKQAAMLKSMGFTQLDHINKGQASFILGCVFARRGTKTRSIAKR